jgi:hypothetical protein
LAYIGTDNKESFPEMLARMQSEGDHGLMTKDEWDLLVKKWMDIYKDIKDKEKSPLLMSYEDVSKMY